jgi:hypothetical protein
VYEYVSVVWRGVVLGLGLGVSEVKGKEGLNLFLFIG